MVQGAKDIAALFLARPKTCHSLGTWFLSFELLRIYLRPSLDVVLLLRMAEARHLNQTFELLYVQRHDLLQQALPCYMTLARQWLKHKQDARISHTYTMLQSSLTEIESSMAEAWHLNCTLYYSITKNTNHQTSFTARESSLMSLLLTSAFLMKSSSVSKRYNECKNTVMIE